MQKNLWKTNSLKNVHKSQSHINGEHSDLNGISITRIISIRSLNWACQIPTNLPPYQPIKSHHKYPLFEQACQIPTHLPPYQPIKPPGGRADSEPWSLCWHSDCQQTVRVNSLAAITAQKTLGTRSRVFDFCMTCIQVGIYILAN